MTTNRRTSIWDAGLSHRGTHEFLVQGEDDVHVLKPILVTPERYAMQARESANWYPGQNGVPRKVTYVMGPKKLHNRGSPAKVEGQTDEEREAIRVGNVSDGNARVRLLLLGFDRSADKALSRSWKKVSASLLRDTAESLANALVLSEIITLSGEQFAAAGGTFDDTGKLLSHIVALSENRVKAIILGTGDLDEYTPESDDGDDDADKGVDELVTGIQKLFSFESKGIRLEQFSLGKARNDYNDLVTDFMLDISASDLNAMSFPDKSTRENAALLRVKSSLSTIRSNNSVRNKSALKPVGDHFVARFASSTGVSIKREAEDYASVPDNPSEHTKLSLARFSVSLAKHLDDSDTDARAVFALDLLKEL